MAHIGGTTCTFVRGIWPLLKMRSRKWQVAGLGGYGILLLGSGHGACQLQAELMSSLIGVNTWANLIEAMQGQIITAENDFGHTTATLFADVISPPQIFPFYVPGTGVTSRGVILIRGTIVG